MKTKRIYYDDAFVRQFEAEVLVCTEQAGNGTKRWRVLLDRTALYPASGGQPDDRGRIGGAEVVEIVDEGEEIAHFVDQPVSLGRVKAEIDWTRRFDHMQQHTGQHLLSAVLQTQFGLNTVSFHLGEEICTIDLRGAEPAAEALVVAERATNGIIFEDRPVRVRYATHEELRGLGVRKEVEREGILRVRLKARICNRAAGPLSRGQGKSEWRNCGDARRYGRLGVWSFCVESEWQERREPIKKRGERLPRN